MKWLGKPIKWFLQQRYPSIRYDQENAGEIQQHLILQLVKKASLTEWGIRYGYDHIKYPEQFKEQCPLNDYDTLKGHIQQMIAGRQNVLWPTRIKWFAKSSGTTSDKSKFIPVSPEALKEGHYKGGFDVMTTYAVNHPETGIFSGKTLIMGGSQTVHPLNNNARYGDISAVMMSNMPAIGQFLRAPELSIALMSEWESKIERLAASTLHQRITSLAGVPTWTIVLINKLFEMTGKNDLSTIWPHLELYIHGGVSFTPYSANFRKLIKNPGMNYLQTYNASEGFFAYQDRHNTGDMLLAINHGIYYEFIPAGQANEDHPATLTLGEVVIGINYALVISTNAGLWRYKVGDTIQFTSLNPYRIIVTGRTKHYINAFGEEVIVDNTDKAIQIVCEASGAEVADYTVAPLFSDEGKNACHQWLIEFAETPEDPADFAVKLDLALQSLNSDYEAKRYKNMALKAPELIIAPKGLFQVWLKNRGKLGGQHKVPRLSNDRKHMDELLAIYAQNII